VSLVCVVSVKRERERLNSFLHFIHLIHHHISSSLRAKQAPLSSSPRTKKSTAKKTILVEERC
jgi:hypothetical protein